MNLKKIGIIIGSILLLFFLGVILMFANALWGNPISGAIASKSIKSYVKETYPDLDVEVSKVSFNFKFDQYFSTVQSITSKDTRFTVGWSGGAIYDSYEYDVLGHYKTYERLSSEFRTQVEEIINREFDQKTSILYGDFGKADTDLNGLTADMPLDITKPPLPTTLVVYYMPEDINYEVLSSGLLELYTIMEKYQIPINIYTVVIQEPLPDGEKPDPQGDSLHLFDFPAEKILSEDLIGEIKAHQKIYEEKYGK